MIIAYGAGELGKLAVQFFNFYNIDYIMCEDNPQYDDILNIDDVSKVDDPLVVVCISTASYNMIRDKLVEKGFKNIKSFFQVAEEINKANGYKHPLTNGWQIKKETKKLIEKAWLDIELKLADSNSKEHYIRFITWHMSYIEIENKDFPINCDNRYFIPEVTSVLHDHEVFVDAGAYDGRVTKKFIEKVKGKYTRIVMFEPQLSYCINIGDDIEDEDNMYLYNACLGNKKGYIPFNNCGYLSKIVSKSDQKERINKLDNLDLTPTFIKYHLEGYELEAIKGSIKNIKKHRPIIAVTTYHTEEGLYKLPMYLIKNLKDYNFYWRNHNYQGQGAVMYCIPKERNR